MSRIEDLALIGDCHSAALVGRDANIEWAAFPRFDAPAVWCGILDPERGGRFSVVPEGCREVRRAYLPETNVLTTTFRCTEGELEVTDCMPLWAEGRTIGAHHAILRRLRSVSGAVRVEVEIAPRFDYGRFVPRFRLTGEETAEIVGGADAIWVTATRHLIEREDRVGAAWRLVAGEEAWLEAAWSPSHELREPEDSPGPDELAERFERTVGFWRGWIGRSWYAGEHADRVRRSALTLKALTYAPTGALVAAPTTSLPEEIGGVRNWDYRYTWIRDTTLTLTSLFAPGFRDEADAFKGWMERTGASRPADLQIMYGICGERSLPELTLDHLAGHRDSAPVRIGNAAADQRQHDAYGQVLQAAYLYGKAGGALTPENWSFLEGLVEVICDAWREPDHGIWEMRDVPRHFTHSKLNCWAGLDRAVRIAEARRLPAPVSRWAKERDAVRDELLADARRRGWFSQALGTDVPDASALLVPAMGLVPTTDPLVQRTIEVVTDELGAGGLVHRYRASDGLHGGEGAFLLCSFWLCDCLIFSGRLEEAEALCERLFGLANDVGLYSEEADVRTEEPLGNFPQAFTHMALVTTCAHLDAAKRGEVPSERVSRSSRRIEGAHDYAEIAVDRLLAAGRRLS